MGLVDPLEKGEGGPAEVVADLRLDIFQQGAESVGYRAPVAGTFRHSHTHGRFKIMI